MYGRGHVTGDKVEKTDSKEWFDKYEEINLAHVEAEEARKAKEAKRLNQSQQTQMHQEDRQMMSPEALCSVNIHFLVKGVGQAQATGRGATPQEAVDNMIGLVEVTKNLMEPPSMCSTERPMEQPVEQPAMQPVEQPKVSRHARLGEWIEKAIQKAKDEPKLQERVMKAVQLVMLGQVEATKIAGTWVVRSQTERERLYRVETTPVKSCACPDFRNHQPDSGTHVAQHGYVCKHILAVCLYRALDGLS